MEFELPIDNIEGDHIENGLGPISRILLSIVGMIEFLYESIYFHLFPFFIYIFIYFHYGNGDSVVKIDAWKEN